MHDGMRPTKKKKRGPFEGKRASGLMNPIIWGWTPNGGNKRSQVPPEKQIEQSGNQIAQPAKKLGVRCWTVHEIQALKEEDRWS